jgi:hypothetical protein
MRRLSIACAAAGLALSALAATSPAEAGFHLIRWQGTGFCQIWDEAVPTKPFPSDYRPVSHSVPTLLGVMAVKDHLVHRGTCKF